MIVVFVTYYHTEHSQIFLYRKGPNSSISYTKADRAWAEWIAWELEEAGYKTVLQAWDFRAGSNFVLEMQRATTGVQCTLAILSAEYFNASFTQSEWAAAFNQDPIGMRSNLIPVRVRDCEPPGLLKSIIYIDLVGLEEADAKKAILDGVCSIRAKPSIKPSFPEAAQRSTFEPPRFPGVKEPNHEIYMLYASLDFHVRN